MAESTGPSTLDASLLFLSQEDSIASTSAPSASFRLTAQHLRVETDSTNLSVAATARSNVLPTTTSRDYESATVHGVDVRDSNYRFLVFPLPDAELPIIHATASQCMRFEPSDSERVEREARVRYSRDPFEADVAASLQWTDCTIASPTIHGDFLLVLWEWDAKLQSGGETSDLWSGRHGAAGIEETRDAAGPATEQYLYAHNATLTIPSLGSHLVHIQDARVETSQVKLVDARGHIPDADEVMDVTDSEVLVKGRIQVTLDGTDVGRPLAARVEGDVEELHVDGQLLTQKALPSVLGGAWPWVWGLLPLVGAVTGAVLVRRREAGRAKHAGRLEDRFHEFYRREEYEAALRCAERLLRLEPDHAQVRVLRALCLGNLGRLGEAYEAHKQIHWRLQQGSSDDADHWIGENAYQAARICMDLRCQADTESGRDEWHQASLQWLQTAFMIDGEHYVAEARLEPDFGPILRDVMMLAERVGGGSEWMQP